MGHFVWSRLQLDHRYRVVGQRGAVENVYTGNYAYGGRGAFYNEQTGAAGAGRKVTWGNETPAQGTAGRATVYNPNTGEATHIGGIKGDWAERSALTITSSPVKTVIITARTAKVAGSRSRLLQGQQRHPPRFRRA